MASDTSSVVSTPDGRPSMTFAEIIAYVRGELETHDEHLAHLARNVTNNGDLPRDAHSGLTLDLSHKNIRELPVEVVALVKDRVERLALSHNAQIAVPTQIVQCDRLRYLNLRWNALKHFPEAILQLSKLEILDISKNRIVAIPEDIKRMSSLKFLAVAKNKITRLPLSLGEMASLSKLKFDDNPIEFPPADALKPQNDRFLNAIETEKEKDVCQQVKRFLRQAGLRQRLMNHSEEDTSESNAETPRPPKRGLGGRFPVRPSVSGIENITDLKTGSPDTTPPVPQRSHARIGSQNLGSQLRRPSIAPVFNGEGDISRSRSETVSSSASLRVRRQGFVPSKRTPSNNHELNPVDENTNQLSTQSGQATNRDAHSCDPSIASTYNANHSGYNGGYASSEAISSPDNQISRYQHERRLVEPGQQITENNQLKSPPIVAARRLLFILSELERPLSRATNGLILGTPQRTMLERQLFSANAHNSELERILGRLDGGVEETPRRSAAAARNMIFACMSSMTAYGVAVKMIRGTLQKLIEVLDPFVARSLMFQIYTTVTEARNVCKMLGYEIVPLSTKIKGTPRTSKAWSSKTVTPTQVKPPANKRLRGATILRSTSSNATLRAAPPPVSLNGNTSRTNTMTSNVSLAAATPRSGGSFSSANSSAVPSRSNTLRSIQASEDSDEGEQFERIFFKLKSACQAATIALPHCHAEFTVHKDNADTAGKIRAAHCWSRALSKCNAVIRANQALSARLKIIKLKDPSAGNEPDFWHLCDTFVQSWTDLATEVKDLNQQRIDIEAVKTVMKPVQRALKDVSRTISDSPLYHAALRSTGARPPTASSSPSNIQHGLAPPFPAGLNTALAQSLAHVRDGPPTSVPATPLAAALGPAAQATLGNHGSLTPSGQQPPMEYFAGPPAQDNSGARDGRTPFLEPGYEMPGNAVQQQPYYRDQQYFQQQQQFPQQPIPQMQYPPSHGMPRRDATR